MTRSIERTPSLSIEPSEDAPPPADAGLKWLKALVIGLTATMIAGLLTIIVLIVMIFMREPEERPLPALPNTVTLPAGETASAVTFGPGWIAVVTTDEAGAERVRVLDAETGAERGVLVISE